MQQKTKFIIFIGLICFISLLFLPIKAWSLNENNGSVGGGGECIQTCTRYTCSGCPDISSGAICPGFWDGSSCCSGSCKTCGQYSPPTIPSWCYDEEEEEKDKEKGWRCPCDGGPCREHISTSPQYSTLAQCEAKCPCGIYKYCSTSGCTADECVDALWYQVNPGNECETDDDCITGVVPPSVLPKYSCNTSTWTCSSDSNGPYSSPDTCQSNCVNPNVWNPPSNGGTPPSNGGTPPSNGGTPPSNGGTPPSNGGTPPSNGGTPPPPPPTPSCEIYGFSLNGKTNEESDPLRVWVGSLIKGLVSTNAYCETCTVESTDTWGNPDPEEYTMTLNNGYNAKEEFRIDTSGTYSFTLTCQGSDPDDIVVDSLSLQTVEALNLPWWQEIIPVLQGFLGGVWR